MKELIDCFSICFQGKAITWNILTLQLQKNNSLDETKILVFKIFLLKGFHNTYLSEYLLSCFVFVFWITSGMLSVHWFKHSHNLTPMQMYCIRIYLVIDFQIKNSRMQDPRYKHEYLDNGQIWGNDWWRRRWRWKWQTSRSMRSYILVLNKHTTI